jgi:hypothetical protein
MLQRNAISRVDTDTAATRDRLSALARLLDSALRIPGTNVRFGLDAVIGLVPGVGDLAGAALAGYIVLAAARLGAPPSVLSRMLLNVAIDTVLGSVPIVGDVFDVAWRANARNVALLDRHVAEPAATRASSRLVVVAVLAALALLVGAGLVAAWLAARALLGHLR